MPFSYKTKALKKRFPELKDLEEHVAVPILEILLIKFLEDLARDYHKYGISGFDIVEEFSVANLCDIYSVLVKTMMIKIKVDYMNIYIIDGDSTWHARSAITFDSGPDDGLARELYNKFLEFAKSQQLAELKVDATLNLQRGNKKHFVDGVAEFYLR